VGALVAAVTPPTRCARDTNLKIVIVVTAEVSYGVRQHDRLTTVPNPWGA